MARRTVATKDDKEKDKDKEKVISYQDYVVRVDPFHYLHVKDTNTNLVQLIVGPRTYTCLDHEKVVFGPEKMVIVPPRHYVVITNPVVKQTDEHGNKIAVLDDFGQPVLRYGDREMIFEGPPFSLYDGEKLGPIVPLKVVEVNTALRLRAVRDFNDRYNSGKHRSAGEEWLFPTTTTNTPVTYYPQVEVEIVSTVKGTVLKSSQALKVKARDDCTDYQGKSRKAGEMWMVKVVGGYLPAVNEEEVEIVNATILTYKNALHLTAKATFTDASGKERKAGEEWLVTQNDVGDDSTMFIPDANEVITKTVNLIALGPHEYCIIKDPVDEKTNKPQLGSRKIVRGRTTFFLKPGETIEGTCPQKSVILGPDDAIWLTATQQFMDTHNNRKEFRKPGQEWICYGPAEYWPILEAKTHSKFKAFVAIEPLGIYLFHPARWLAIFLVLFGIWLNRIFSFI